MTTAQGATPAWRLGAGLFTLALLAMLLGLGAGSQGWSLGAPEDLQLIRDIRAPRTLGALLAGSCLGLAGAIAQGLFRNPLADPYLLGSASGAGLGVTFALSARTLSQGFLVSAPAWVLSLGLTSAAFVGALAGVAATLVCARGSAHPMRLLLAGIVVGVLATAGAEALALLGPAEIWRDRQAFLLGTTSFLSWHSVALLAAALGLVLPVALSVARVLDALALGYETALSLGLDLRFWSRVLIACLALLTGTAVAQCGLIAFVGLAAPHLIRRRARLTHRPLLALSTLTGGVLLALADGFARSIAAPHELPVGLLTALLGGLYLLALLHREPTP